MIPSGGREAHSLGEIERVRSRHERSLMAIEGVRGVALGRGPIGDDALVVYVVDERLAAAFPPSLRDIPSRCR